MYCSDLVLWKELGGLSVVYSEKGVDTSAQTASAAQHIAQCTTKIQHRGTMPS